MPNIEIHGLSAKEAKTLEEKVFSLFKGFEFFIDMVVTFCPTDVRNYKGEKQPFLRLLNSSLEYNPIIIKKMKTLKIDIEVVKLEAFYPK